MNDMLASTGILYNGRADKDRGSNFRDGRSVTAFGTKVASIGAGASVELTIPIREPGLLGKLVVGGAPAELASCTISSIKLNNDELHSGEVPADMYAKDSLASPGFGHKVRVKDELQVVVVNNGAAATGPISAGFSVA